MLANASYSNSIKDSFLYARAVDEPEKGGRIVKSNCVFSGVPIDVQVAMMTGLTFSEYDVEAYTIVISHSEKDTEKIREMTKEDPDFPELYVDAFADELQKRGVDLANTPFVITEHTNTKCLHYHMVICSTKFDNSRLDSGFIGKKAAMAAAAVSRKFGLDYATNLDEREKTFRKKSSKIQNDFVPPLKRKRRTKEQIAEDAARKKKEKEKRAQAVKEAQERKSFLKKSVESAFAKAKNKSEFRTLLAEKKVGISKIVGKGWCVLYTDEKSEDKKTRIYAFSKLSIDNETISNIESMLNRADKYYEPSWEPTYLLEEADNTVESIKDVFVESANKLEDLLSIGDSEQTVGIGGGSTKNLSNKKKKKGEEDDERNGWRRHF